MQESWKDLILEALQETGEDFNDLQTTLTDEEMIANPDSGFPLVPFTAWGPMYVYFPVMHDGVIWVGYAPRNPCDVKTEYQGS